MAYHKKLFEKYGGLRTDLGPQPDSEIRGEDSEFGFRLLAEGERDVMSLLRSFITPYRKIGCGKSTSWDGGLTKAAPNF